MFDSNAWSDQPESRATGQAMAVTGAACRLALMRVCLALSFILSSVLGCHRLQLPAIDPNGSCLFLPFPNTTGLQVPNLHSSPDQPGFLPSQPINHHATACLGGIAARCLQSICNMNDYIKYMTIFARPEG